LLKSSRGKADPRKATSNVRLQVCGKMNFTRKAKNRNVERVKPKEVSSRL